MHFIDRMFLMWHSKAAIAATMPAGMLHFTLLCFPLGIALYVNTFVAQYHGARRDERIGAAVWQGVRVAALTTPVFLLTIPLAPFVFHNVGHEPSVASLETVYFQVLTFGGGGVVLCGALSSFFSGRGEVCVVMYANMIQAALNIVLDYVWIFGHFGFPEPGIEGAGWATVTSIWVKAVLYLALISRPRYWTQFGFASSRQFDGDLFRRLFKYGVPNGLQMVVDCAAFTVFLFFVGLLGMDALAATTLAFNVSSMAFVPLIGLGIAVSTMVGRNQGASQPDLSARSTWTAFAIALVYMGTQQFLAAPNAF